MVENITIKEKLFNFAMKTYIKYCVFTRNIDIRKPPKLPKKTNQRILFISSDNVKNSGAFRSLVNLCDILINKYDLDVFVILPYYGNGKKLLDERKIPNVIIKSFAWGIPLSKERDESCLKEISDKKLINESSIRKITEFIKTNEFDLVHINTSGTYVGACASLNAKVPFVWHIREMLESGLNFTMWDRKKGNKLINKANKVITVSNSIYEIYSEFIDNDKLLTIYDGIDVGTFYNPKKEILKENIIKFIFIGYVSKNKGIYDFANACVKLHEDEFKDFEVLIVGLGVDKDIANVKNIFNKARMDDKVSFLGFQNDVTKFLEQSDVFCMCTKFEAFGRTTVEAMLAGNVVIGANTAGTKDLIDDKKTGILYNQGDSDDLCDKMKWVIENKKDSQNIAKSGQEYMFKNMSSERNADEIYNLYKELLEDC